MSQKRILVVEDKHNILQAYRVFFKREKQEMISATDIIGALTIFDSQKIDLIIINLSTNNKSELDYLKEKRKKFEVPVIVTSTYSKYSFHKMLEQLEVNYFFQKPLEIGKMQKVIKRLLNSN